MPWKVEYIADFEIIQCVYIGNVTMDDFKEATKKSFALAKNHQTGKILIDNSKLEIIVSTTEIYELPQFYDNIKLDRRSRWAIILPTVQPALRDVQFFETVCRNRGWSVKAFDNHENAMKWLMQDTIPDQENEGDG
jgi:hypothetical protein